MRRQPGADTAEAAWAGTVAGPGTDCDATIIPVVSGHVDPDVLDQLTREVLNGLDHASHSQENNLGQGISSGQDASQSGPDAAADNSDADAARRKRTERTVHQMLVKSAADLLSGPGGLAAYLRKGLSDRLVASVSLPLDVGATVEIIPAHDGTVTATSPDRRRVLHSHGPPVQAA